MHWTFSLVVCCTCLHTICGYPDGAPNTGDVCRSMRPNHPGQYQNFRPPFEILVSDASYLAGQDYTVTIRATTSKPLKGFLLKATRTDPTLNTEEAIGRLHPIDDTKRVCQSPFGNGLTHTDPSDKRELVFTWTAPAVPTGHIHFRVTYVTGYTEYWIAEESDTMRDLMFVDIERPTTKKPVVQNAFEPIDLSGCGDTKGCYSNPQKCSANRCDIVVTWKSFDDHVQFEMSADTHGWVAVGFSSDKKMGRDSVTECVWIEEESHVEVRQSFNTEPGKRNEVLNIRELGLYDVSGTYSDGRVSCRFKRAKDVSAEDRIFDLSSLHYHLLMAKGNATVDGQKKIHLLEPYKYPYVSVEKVSMMSNVDISGTARYPLVKLHGIFMIIAWMMCATTAILMARYYKPMWPNDRVCNQRIWFAVHRACMLVALFATIIGFIVIFVHTDGYSQMPELPDSAHPPIGITATILCILNPLIAICRCDPNSRRRPIFNWIHWFIGTCAFILATVAMILGLNLPKSHVPWWAGWVMVSFMLFHLVIELLLEMHGCINSRKQKQREMEVEIRKRNEHGNIQVFEPDPVGTRFKTIIIALYLFVCIVLTLVMVIAVAIG